MLGPMPSLFEAADSPLLFAHRGAAEHLPENSLPAFAHALDVGADVLEIDVHMTRDGHVVVAHDRDGKRTAGEAAAIADCGLDALRAWDLRAGLGACDLPEPVRVPTLAEVLDVFPGVRLNIDVKPTDPAIVSPLLALLSDRGASEHVLLTSFDRRVLARIRAAGYAGPTGCARSEAARLLLAPASVSRRGGVPGRRLQIPEAFAGLRLDVRSRIERAHALGLLVDYWVVNDPSQAERLLDMGADGIVSDFPDRIAPVFEAHVRCRAYRARRKGCEQAYGRITR